MGQQEDNRYTPGHGLGTPPRLVRSLDRLLRGRVAVISAPAGHGKSTLVEAWLSTHPEFSSHWVRDSTDLDEAVAGHEEGHDLLVLVLAHGELIADQALVAHALDLAERDARLRLVFTGRSRPEAPLGTLAARGLLVDLDANQLAWTRDEVRRALLENNPNLPDEALDQIMAGMRGWPAIVTMLAAEELTWSHTSKMTRLADSYIADEVLAGLSSADVDLLQELAALPSLAPLAAAWMTGRGDAAAQLSRLQAHGVPITWDDANTIQLNPMLRGYLIRELARNRPDRHAELSQRAALWLRNRGQQLEAIDLAMTVGLVDLAWMLAAEFITVHLNRPELMHALPQLVELLPPGWELDMVRSISRGLATPQTMIAQIATVDPHQMIERNTTGRLGYTALALGMVRRVGYPDEFDIGRALEIAREADSSGVHELDLALLSVVRTEYGLWLLHQGRLSEAREVLMSALGMARVVNVPWAIVITLSALSLIHAEHGAVSDAHRLADEAILISSDTVFTTDGLDEFALMALARTAIDTGDLAAARRWLDQLNQHEDHLAENDAFRTHTNANLLMALGDPAGARRLVDAYRDQPRPTSTVMHDSLIARAAFDASLAMGDVAAAQQEFDRMEAMDLPEGKSGLVVLRARLALTKGDSRTAYGLLEPVAEQGGSALDNARHTLHALMIFGVAADDMHRGDEALQAFQRAGVLADRLGVNTPNARHTRMAVASRKEVPLTEAERHVLANLDSSQTLGETAEQLFISLNTLKTHLRRIYKKLGVANRDEAIDRARVMGLRS